MLTEQLATLLESTQALQVLLEEEKTCLKEKKFDNLNTLLFNKQKLLQSINSINALVSTEQNLATIQEAANYQQPKKIFNHVYKNAKKIMK